MSMSSTTDTQTDALVGAEEIARRTVRSAHTRLSGSSYAAALRRLRCSYHEGVLTISGTLSRYYLKQIAHSLVRQLDEVEILVDHIHVVEPPS